mmetsp:Transcript_29383/g.94319  ORF Transcript_29383/g.94319 Transcript_29383/m.94319 type:complete len:302 (-) Transcript_29383:1228-2133(-)
MVGVRPEEAACEVGEARLHDGELRIQLQAQAFERAERADDKSEVGRDLQRELLSKLLELFTDTVDGGAVHVLKRRGATALAQRAEHLGDDGCDDTAILLVLAQLRVEESEGNEILQSFLELLARKVRHVLHHGVLLRLGDLRHETTIQDADATVLKQQEVARVRVAVQEARLQELREIHVQQHVDVILNALLFGCVRRVNAGDLHAVKPLRHDGVPARAKHAGHGHHVRQIINTRQVPPKSRRGARLAVIVKLVDETGAVDINDANGALCVAANARLFAGDARNQIQNGPRHDEVTRARLQ